MKRLIRKASIDYTEFLEDILYDKSYYNEENIENVINENTDCIYTGNAYRVFFFDPQQVQSIRDEYLNENNIDINNTNKEELASYIANALIRVDGTYQSFTKSLEGLQYAADTLYEEGIQLSIECKISGLDLEKLCTKLKDNGFEARVLDSYFDEYKAEEEVLVKFDNSNFKVHNYEDLVNSIINL